MNVTREILIGGLKNVCFKEQFNYVFMFTVVGDEKKTGAGPGASFDPSFQFVSYLLYFLMHLPFL